jgi:perosamine synthetase
MATDPPYGTANFQSFWVALPAGAPPRDTVLAHLASRGVSARRGIMAAHLEPAYDDHPHAPLPVTERLTRNSLILPLFHEMTEHEQDHVVTALTEALTGTR